MSLFREPIPFADMWARLQSKSLLPTNLNSAQIQETYDSDILEHSIFSASTTKGEILQGYKDELGDLLTGRKDIATARARIQDLFNSLSYDPENGHFGTEEDALIPPATKGSLRDLSSRGRIDLVLQTNMRLIANYGFKEQGQSDFSLFAYPCYELIRIYPRRIPRGEALRKGQIITVPGEDWPSRWEKVGGQFYGGRMIARKDDPIWQEIGSTANFSDALNTDVPPFAWGSGYGLREVPRRECISLGVITAATDIQGSKSSMNQGMEAAARFDVNWLKSVRDKLDLVIEKKKIALANKKAALIPSENAGTSNGAKKGWITRRMGKQIAAQTFDEAMKKGGGSTPAKAYLRVDSGAAAKIKKATGLDLSGYEHAIDGSGIRHAMTQHGDPVSESKRGLVAITKADFEKLPIVVSKPDSVTFGTKTRGGLDAIVYRRKVGNETFMVEEVRAGKKQLVLKTMYKKP